VKGPCTICWGNGCVRCASSGACPGCGEEWSTRRSPLPADECREMGRIPWQCSTCGRLVRIEEMAARLYTAPEARA
jgi:hypothetical protein